MKLNFTQITLMLLLGFIHQSAFSQYTVTSNNESWAALVSGGSCNNCTINIPAGWTLKLNSNGACNGCTFNGGTVQITSSFTFNNNITTFNNDTVQVQTPTSFYSVAFNDDSVAVTSTLSTNNSMSTFSNSRVYASANMSFNEASFSNDSVHLTAGLSFNNTPDDISGSHFTVTGGGYIAAQGGTFSNDVFSFNGNAYFSDNNAFNTSSTTFFLDGNSYVKANGNNTIDATNFYMSGNSYFAANNALSFTGNSILGLSGNSYLTTAQLTTSGGSITMTGANKISSSNAVSLTNTPLYMGSTSDLAGSSFSASGASITMAGNNYINSSNAIILSNAPVSMVSFSYMTGSSFDAANSDISMSGTNDIKSSNAVNVTGGTVTMAGASYMTGSSMDFKNDNMTMSGSSYLKTSNQLTIDATAISMSGSSDLDANVLYLQNISSVVVGDGSVGSTAWIHSNNQMTVADNSNIRIANENNYFYSGSSSVTGGSHSYSISNDTYNCNQGSVNTYTNTCKTDYVYGCQTINASGILACTVLAISDFNLKATPTAADEVLLSWQDEDYTDADHYVVERNTGNYEWTSLASVSLSGGVSGSLQYTDPSAPSGTVYYRIARVDKAGSTTYTSVISIVVSAGQASIQIFPNPVTGNSFNIATTSTAAYVVNLYTITGQLLARLDLKGATLYTVQRPAQLPTGSSLVVQIIGRQGSKTFPLIIR